MSVLAWPVGPSSFLTANIPNCRKIPGYSPALCLLCGKILLWDLWGSSYNLEHGSEYSLLSGFEWARALSEVGESPPSPACVPGRWQEGSPQRQAASLGNSIPGIRAEQPAQAGPPPLCWEWMPAVAEMGVLKGRISRGIIVWTEAEHFPPNFSFFLSLSAHPWLIQVTGETQSLRGSTLTAGGARSSWGRRWLLCLGASDPFQPSDPFSPEIPAPRAAPGGYAPKALPAPSSWEGDPWRGPFVQGSQFLPPEAFAAVIDPFGLGVPGSVGRTRAPLRLPQRPGSSQVSVEQGLMDHGLWLYTTLQPF